MNTSFETLENEIVSFVFERLQNFKKIHYKYLTEVIERKFQKNNLNELLKESLIKTHKAKIKRGYLLIYEESSIYN